MRVTSTFALGPSKAAIRKASQLGMEMARRERRCVPDLASASHYDRYVRYRNYQRERLEATQAFCNDWLDKIMHLAEREGKAAGLRMDDSMASWDIWYNAFVNPLKEAFWYAWEHTWDLPARYAATRRITVESTEKASVLKVADAVYHAEAEATPADSEQAPLLN